MDGQNGTRMSDQEATRSAEPRGWALHWDGSALSQADTQERENGSRGARCDRFALSGFEMQASEKGDGVSVFARPRSWALEWDGLALAEADGCWNGSAA
jgi:hypothetical protein